MSKSKTAETVQSRIAGALLGSDQSAARVECVAMEHASGALVISFGAQPATAPRLAIYGDAVAWVDARDGATEEFVGRVSGAGRS